MTRNEATNSPIQGPAFHCLLWTHNHVSDELKARGMKAAIDGQIHDCLHIEAPPEEDELLRQIVRKYGVEEIRNDRQFSWLCTPLAMELERSEIDGNWAEMEDCGYI